MILDSTGATWVQKPDQSWKHTYQLVLGEDGAGTARTIEFEAVGPEVALYMAQQQCRGRPAELIEDGRSLGQVQCVPHGGYWLLSPSARPGGPG